MLAKDDPHMFPSTISWISLLDLCSAVQRHATGSGKGKQMLFIGRHARLEAMREVVDTVCCYDRDEHSPVKSNDHAQAANTHDLIIANQLDEATQSTFNFYQVLTLNVNVTDRIGRCIGILSNGRLALVPDNPARAGDNIAILHGLNVPCVLRKVDGKNEYTYQGAVFIKGLMQGEAVDWDEVEADNSTLV